MTLGRSKERRRKGGERGGGDTLDAAWPPPPPPPATVPVFRERITITACLLSHLFLLQLHEMTREYLQQREMKMKDLTRVIGCTTIFYLVVQADKILLRWLSRACCGIFPRKAQLVA